MDGDSFGFVKVCQGKDVTVLVQGSIGKHKDQVFVQVFSVR